MRKLVIGLSLAFAAAPAVQAAPAPASGQLGLARSVAAKVLPPGSYQRMMRGTFDTMAASITTQMLNVPLRQFVAAAGMRGVEVDRLGDTTGRQIIAIIDPAFEQRMRLSSRAIMDGLVDVMARMEPDMREGMAEAYAARFSEAELRQIAGFFATEAGGKFASQQLTIISDPAFAGRMQGMMRTVTGAMPDLFKRAAAATASLPPAKTAAQLTPDERTRLAALFGTTPDSINPQATEPQR